MRRLSVILAVISATVSATAAAEKIAEREGWRVIETDMSYGDLVAAVIAAVPEAGLGVVTQAGPTEAAAGRGVTIPGNRVIGVFNNEVAVRILALSTAAMIEAPVRFYVTEDADGGATLAWKTPSLVFAPYVEEAGPELEGLAGDLDARFEAVAAAATGG